MPQGRPDTGEENQKVELPEILGILPIRNAVAFPGTVTPLAIGRERSLRLLADIAPNESIIGLLTQKNPKTDKPDFSDLCAVGSASPDSESWSRWLPNRSL